MTTNEDRQRNASTRILLLVAGMREDSASAKVAAVVAHHLERGGFTPVPVYTSRGSFPHREPRHDSELPQSAAELRQAVKSCAGAVWIFPVYHGSYPGTFKNAIDFLEQGAFAGRPTAIVTVAGGGLGQVAWTQAAFVAQVLGALVVPKQMCVPDSWKWHKADTNGVPDEAVEKRLRELADALAMAMPKPLVRPLAT